MFHVHQISILKNMILDWDFIGWLTKHHITKTKQPTKTCPVAFYGPTKTQIYMEEIALKSQVWLTYLTRLISMPKNAI